MLTETEQSALITAVPSFAAQWRAHLEMHAAYVELYPDAALTPVQHTHDFLGDLAGRLGIAVAAGELHEAEWWRQAYSYTQQ